jgi:DNA-binding response OmpR family regulator
MENKRFSDTGSVAITDLTTLLEEAPRQIWPVKEHQVGHPTSYRLALGQEIIQLGIVEFRILLFLAGRPYHAFTRRNIAEAISSEQNPVTEDTVDRHVASLLDQLGVFNDYVQSVPYIGYRFKA